MSTVTEFGNKGKQRVRKGMKLTEAAKKVRAPKGQLTRYRNTSRGIQDDREVERETSGPDVLVLRGDTLDGTHNKFLILKRDTL